MRNYFNILRRNLARHSVFSFINIFGLSLGIACNIIVILFIRNELSYDQFFANAGRIYRPYNYIKDEGREITNVYTPFIMGKQLKENYPEIEACTNLSSIKDRVQVNEISFNETIHIASDDFFRIFDFKVIDGTTTNVFKDPSGVVITRDMANKYFSRTHVAGEQLRILIGSGFKDFTIKAVLNDIPSNSSIRFDFLISDHYLKDIYPESMMTSWFMIAGENYLLLKKGVNPDELVPKFSSLIEQALGDDLDRMDFKIYLQPLTDIHLNTDMPAGDVPVSDSKYIYILSAISILILAIAAINFVMLSLGQSVTRSREIGIRKSSGADQIQIMIQFLGESVFLALLALVIGICLAYLMLPWFNELANQHLSLNITPVNIFIYFILSVLTGLLAGFYPAWVISGFNPIRILRGNLKIGQRNSTFGSFLITGQFILFVVLIGCTIIMKDQMHFIRNKNLGFDKDNILVVPLNTLGARGVVESIKKGFEKGGILKNEVEKLSEVKSAGITSQTFEPGTWTRIGYRDNNNDMKYFYYNAVGPDFIPTLGIRMLRGRDFEINSESDYRRSIIVNEAFIKAYDLGKGPGQQIPGGNFDDHEIIGVVENFNFQSLHDEIKPLVLSLNPDIIFSGANEVSIGISANPKLLIRLRANMIEKGITDVGKTWGQIFPGEIFDYSFVDQGLRKQYEQEQNLGKIVASASILAVVIGSLGLFGLSILAFASRIKEISIRKVLGAPSGHILYVLSRRFILLLSIALFISIPITWQIMMKWLEEYKYSVSIEPWIFGLTAVLSFLIIIISLSYQGMSAIRTNPAKTLRNE